MTETILSFIISGLMGVAMFFMKQNNDANKDRIDKLEKELNHVKDNYVKQDYFREFKDELWVRLDKMEVNFDRKIAELKK